MTGGSNGGDEPVGINYAVRLTERARRDADAARDRFAEISGDAVADAWEDGLYEGIATLARLPDRLPMIPENNLFKSRRGPVRQFVYRRRSSAPAYRVLYVVMDGKPDDGPSVNVLHLRHGSARPITSAEARAIVVAE